MQRIYIGTQIKNTEVQRIQGYRKYRSTENTDTENARYKAYRGTDNTGIQRIQRYRGTPYTEI